MEFIFLVTIKISKNKNTALMASTDIIEIESSISN